VSELKIGYARVSTVGQDLTAQRDALAALAVDAERVYVDYGLTGTNRARPGLREALAACRTGDTLVVTKLDRLARSVPDARDIVDELSARGVRLNLGGSIHDPTDPVGRLLFKVLSMVAESKPTSPARAPAKAWPSPKQKGSPRQAAQTQAPAGTAPRRALERRQAHHPRTRRTIRHRPLHRLPRHPASRQTMSGPPQLAFRLLDPPAEPVTGHRRELHGELTNLSGQS